MFVAAREAAAAVASRERATKGRRHRAPLPAEREQLAVALVHIEHRGVARQPSSRLGGKRLPVGELTAPVRVVLQRARVDMDDDLVALAAGPIRIGLGQREICHGDERLRVRDSLFARRRLVGGALPERRLAGLERA